MHSDEALLILLGLVLAVIFVLPIVALVRTLRIGRLDRRLQGVEAALRRVTRELEALQAGRSPAQLEPPAQPVAPSEQAEVPPPEPSAALPDVTPTPAPAAKEIPPPAPATQAVPSAPAPPRASGGLEEMIGQRWLGWVAVSLILFAAAFFLKYAFENRWIGEVGRVAIGMFAGVGFMWAGWRRHRAGWRYFAQVLSGGGIILVYLSTYASFGFYQLIDQRSAFAFLVLVVVQGHLMAVAYNSRAIALMSQIGGFLVPILLSTGRDQYVVLFSYIALLNVGVVIVSFLRQWEWVGSFSFTLTHLLFWGWYADHYHPEKRAATLLFQLVIFALFLLADVAPQLRRRASSGEQWTRLFVNPFVFFATAYHLLEDDYSQWMGAFALVMATLYALLARGGLQLKAPDRRSPMIAVGVALTFVTLAIPIQLESNWISIGWAAQGAILAWLSPRLKSPQLRAFSAVVLGLALIRHLESDTPWHGRLLFTPVVNRYFLGALALVALLLLAAYFRRELKDHFSLGAVLVALGLFWLAMSVETYTYSDALEAALPAERSYDQVRQIRWQGQMVLSVLWSLYATVLVAAGFRTKHSVLRWAGLCLFGVTVLKVVLVDMSVLGQIYRIIAFLALGLLLLAVAWAYQRILRREQTE